MDENKIDTLEELSVFSEVNKDFLNGMISLRKKNYELKSCKKDMEDNAWADSSKDKVKFSSIQSDVEELLTKGDKQVDTFKKNADHADKEKQAAVSGRLFHYGMLDYAFCLIAA